LTSAPPANARESRVAALIGNCTIEPAPISSAAQPRIRSSRAQMAFGEK